MLILDSGLPNPSGLSFSPDGLALLAAGESRVQVWPRYLDAPPRPVKNVQHSLERCALSEDASRVYLYVSGNSYTRVLNLNSGKEGLTKLPRGGPSWFHFDADGGYFLISHDRGKLTRFDHDPKIKKGARLVWSIERPSKGPDDEATVLGSHYRFGAICDAAGIFVALEYRYGTGEPLDGLVVRSVGDGHVVHHQKLPDADGRMLITDAGLTLAIHPSGAYFAFPQKNRVRLWPLADGVKVPDSLKQTTRGVCHAIAFHPSGSLLAVACGDGSVKLYDTATWKLMRTLAWGIGPLRAVCFSPDGTRGAAISGGKKGERKVVVWDVDL